MSRLANDAYFTPPALAAAICRVLVHEVVGAVGDILEPSAGSGSFVRAARVAWAQATICAEDIDQAAVDALNLWGAEDRRFTANVPSPNHASSFSLVIGNCPYTNAEEHVRAALARTRHGGYVAMLLRLSFLAGAKRAALYIEHPLWALIPIAGRPSFTGKGNDNSEYGVMIWRVGFAGPGLGVMKPLIWRAAK
jgi:hypothetical protein